MKTTYMTNPTLANLINIVKNSKRAKTRFMCYSNNNVLCDIMEVENKPQPGSYPVITKTGLLSKRYLQDFTNIIKYESVVVEQY